jgi:hypothetical protein
VRGGECGGVEEEDEWRGTSEIVDENEDAIFLFD